MGTAKDVLAAYRKLSDLEQLEVRAALNEFEDDDWDKQMKADAAAGKLDFLFDQAIAAEKNGTLKDLCA